jgi:hypothetical protein
VRTINPDKKFFFIFLNFLFQKKKKKLYKVRWDYIGAFHSIFNSPGSAMVSKHDQDGRAARAIRDLIPDGHGLDEENQKKFLLVRLLWLVFKNAENFKYMD